MEKRFVFENASIYSCKNLQNFDGENYSNTITEGVPTKGSFPMLWYWVKDPFFETTLCTFILLRTVRETTGRRAWNFTSYQDLILE